MLSILSHDFKFSAYQGVTWFIRVKDIADDLNTLGIVWRFIKDRTNLTTADKNAALDKAVEYQKLRNAEVKNDYLPLRPLILKNRG